MIEHTRIALYAVPAPHTPLARFGHAWLGWDCETACETRHPRIARLPAPVEQITAVPRKYGFHGTLRAPFRLVADSHRQALRAAVAKLAGGRPRVDVGRLVVSTIGPFVALTPQGRCAALDDLAACVVRDLHPFAAAPGEDELARRRKAGLSPAQDSLLAKWGYPYVLEEFHFHMTLSGPLDRRAAEALRVVLGEHLEEILAEPFVVEDICLCGERADGRFELIERFSLRG